MKLIIGLGNPGEKYKSTRHNVGFMILDKLAEKKGIVFRLEPHFEARFAEMGDLQNRIKLVKPQTFMNDSGRGVAKVKKYWKVDSEDIWVIHDDVDLPFGAIRINLGGSSAGHKGIQSIIGNIGEEFWRIRVGVGKDASTAGGDEKIPTEEWVLMNFTKIEKEKLSKIIDETANLVLESLGKEIKEQTIKMM